MLFQISWFGQKRIEPVVQKTYQTLVPSLKLKVTQLLQKCRIAKNITKSSSRIWKLSVCLSGLPARGVIFACVTFLMNCHVTRQVTWFPRNLQWAFDPTGALCPTLPYSIANTLELLQSCAKPSICCREIVLFAIQIADSRIKSIYQFS